MKFNCIIDTSSYINLNNANFGQKSVLKYLYDAVNLNFSREVHLEIRDHYKTDMPSFLRRQRDVLGTRKHSIPEYERRITGKVLTSRTQDKKSKDKGELDNFALSVDQIIHNRKNGVVYIADDGKASRSILSGWFESFPTISVWSSYEVVLFLYSEKVIPSKEIAVDLIQQLNSFFAPKKGDALAPEKRNEISQKLIKKLKEYNDRIEKVSKIIYN